MISTLYMLLEKAYITQANWLIASNLHTMQPQLYFELHFLSLSENFNGFRVHYHSWLVYCAEISAAIFVSHLRLLYERYGTFFLYHWLKF